MELYFLRHGRAVDPESYEWMSDADRPLTKKGKKEVQKVARRMKKLGFSFDCILTSPYVRAFDTAKIVAKTYKLKESMMILEDLIPSAIPQNFLNYFSSLQKEDKLKKVRSCLLVGHEPSMSRLISFLLGKEDLEIDLAKAGLCILEIPRNYDRLLQTEAILKLLVPPEVFIG